MKAETIDRRLNDYVMDFASNEEQDLYDDVSDMEENSEWRDGITTADLKLEVISMPLEAAPKAHTLGLDPTLALEESNDESLHLVVCMTYNGEILPAKNKANFCADNTAWKTIKTAAKLDGSALTRMDPAIMSAVLNRGLEVARGKSMVLIRYDKVFAIHSDTYCPMPISELLKIAKEELTREFGTLAFRRGHNEHAFTSCVWELPAAKDKLMQVYEDTLKQELGKRLTNATHYDMDYMPGVSFYSSDTQASAAKLVPVFITPGGVEIWLADGIAVRHDTSNNKSCMQLFRDLAGDIYAQFTDAAEKAAELAKVSIYNPVNCVVSLSKKFGIPKKYGSLAVDEIQSVQGSDVSVSALDIYIALSNMIEYAKGIGATDSVALDLREKIARTLRVTDWAEHDVSGVIAW